MMVPIRLTQQVKCCQVSADSEKYQRIAPLYDILELPFEYGRYRRLRRLVFDGL